MKKIRIILIVPRSALFRTNRKNTCKNQRSNEINELTFTQLPYYLPKDICDSIILLDEGCTRIDISTINADIIGISARSSTIDRAYVYADYFRSKGIPVVMGGVHPTLNTEEALLHSDAVVKGVAMQAWPAILKDFLNGHLNNIYDYRDARKFTNDPFSSLAGKPDLSDARSLYATYGCPNKCSFCIQPITVNGYYKRPLDDVISDIRSFKTRQFSFLDPNLTADTEYAMELFKRLEPLNKRWSATLPVSFAYNEELVSQAAKSGCMNVFIGFESVDQKALNDAGKTGNNVQKYEDAIHLLHKYKINIIGSFVLGLGNDSKSSADDIRKFFDRNNIEVARFTINTPFPGTANYEKMKAGKRIADDNLALYDSFHAVIYHNGMTREELQNVLFRSFLKAAGFFTGIKRTLCSGNRRALLINVLINLSITRLARKIRQYTPEQLSDNSDIHL